MCLTEEFFIERDRLVELRKEQGYIHESRLQDEFNISYELLRKKGLYKRVPFTTATLNPLGLTPLGKEFFIEEYQVISLKPGLIKVLKEFLQDAPDCEQDDEEAFG